MTLYLKKVSGSSDQEWNVVDGSRLVGTFHLDRICQMQKVVLHPDGITNEHLEVLRVALTHAMLYYRRRRYDEYPTGKFGRLTASDSISKIDESAKLLSFAKIHKDVKNAPRSVIEKALSEWGITIIKAVHQFELTMKKILSHKLLKGVRFKTEEIYQPSIVKITFSISGSRSFHFWKALFPREAPSDHPESKKYKHYYLINGHTNAVISNAVIESIYAPKDVGGSWESVKHPYHAKCKSFMALVDKRQILSEEGSKELTNFLLAALGENKSYISVSGFGR